jgi:hypothetical protein
LAVYFGIGTVLRALASSPLPVGSVLGRLKVEFKKPIFLDEEYELETRRTSDLTVEYIYRKDQAVISRGSFAWKPADSVQETERVAAPPSGINLAGTISIGFSDRYPWRRAGSPPLKLPHWCGLATG